MPAEGNLYQAYLSWQISPSELGSLTCKGLLWLWLWLLQTWTLSLSADAGPPNENSINFRRTAAATTQWTKRCR